jgi:hypothetical protein
MLVRAKIRHYDAAPPEYIVAIGVGEDMVAKRDLRGKSWDDDETLVYKAWLAAKRQKVISCESSMTAFEAWVATVSEVDVILTRKMIDQSLAAGQVSAAEADAAYALVEEDSEGESQAPRSE